ncbi:MAG TPA: hypothetical protein VHW71_07980 [Steroidobacteraceae bacterium]|jgi:hypothetical protein|nr:hypothetical protein [Steroidobacteraceae bacterium]
MDESVPMGLSATFAVTATGSSLQYQWAKNGAAIAGATGSSYTTSTTTFADTGANFSVTVSNSAGTAISNAASLTVTARAPMAGDLRFQQVDAPSTVNGWGNSGVGLNTFLLGRSAQDFFPSIGTIARQSTWQGRVKQDGKGSRGVWIMPLMIVAGKHYVEG